MEVNCGKTLDRKTDQPISDLPWLSMTRIRRWHGSVPGISDEVRVAVDQSLCVCRTDDGGKTWQDFRDGLPQNGIFDIVFRHALDVSGDIVAFGSTTGNLYLSDNLGASWECISSNLPMVHSVEFV